MITANETIAVLAERFPSTFFIYEVRRRPLKIGIYHDLLAAASDIDSEALRRRCVFTAAPPGICALALQVRSASILTAMRLVR